MGQYYKLINIDKKEYIDPGDFGQGLKLMEHSYTDNEYTNALLYLLKDRWKGDRVYEVGDYAVADDEDEPFYATLLTVQEEFNIKPDLDESCTLYAYATKHFKNISGQIKSKSKHVKRLRYIYNTETCEYIDLQDGPIQWVYYDFETDKLYTARIFPLTLLLAMGNKRGGGDYYSKASDDLVGSWCASAQYLEIDSVLRADYVPFSPDFTEINEIIEDTPELKLEAKAHAYDNYKSRIQYAVDEAKPAHESESAKVVDFIYDKQKKVYLATLTLHGETYKVPFKRDAYNWFHYA